MEKTLNINLAGQLFRIDEEGHRTLSLYLERVADRFRGEPGSDETIADIESRIAEIFGNGSEPPTLVSRQMVDDMIGVMGAPESYGDESGTPATGRPLPGTLTRELSDFVARSSRALSPLWSAGRRILAGIVRALAVTLGTLFMLFGFFFLILLGLFFFGNDAPLVQSSLQHGIDNIPLLLSIALNSDLAQTVWRLAAAAVLIPLAALVYLGIKLVFRLGPGSRAVKMTAFIGWIAALCTLAVLLILRLSAYAVREETEERISLTPPPRTVWIAAMKKTAEIGYDEKATVDHFNFWKNSATGRLFCTPELYIHASDSLTGWLAVKKRASGNSETAAWTHAHQIDFSWKWSGDTLYLDEYFSLPAGAPWNGATLFIALGLPEGTEIKPLPGSSLAAWRFGEHHPEATHFRIEEGGARAF